jgi:D-sedoheptulose 7-phosphate isomerase
VTQLTKIFCFDLDGTLCTNTFGDYENAKPLENAILKVNSLYDLGNQIKIFTARGTSSGKNLRKFTELQLNNWKVSYHELIFGKPEADFYIDDRGVNAVEFLPKIDGQLKPDSAIEYFQRTILTASAIMLRGSNQITSIVRTAELVTETLRSGGKVLWCGNGGSAADSQHLAAELVGRFAKNRGPLTSIALTTDSSIITALGNDYGFETIFSRQVAAIGRSGDVLICISTSGESENVIQAAEAAKNLGIATVAFTGSRECTLDSIVDISVKAQSDITGHIQESHISWGQAICGYAEKEIFPS